MDAGLPDATPRSKFAALELVARSLSSLGERRVRRGLTICNAAPASCDASSSSSSRRAPRRTTSNGTSSSSRSSWSAGGARPGGRRGRSRSPRALLPPRAGSSMSSSEPQLRAQRGLRGPRRALVSRVRREPPRAGRGAWVTEIGEGYAALPTVGAPPPRIAADEREHRDQASRGSSDLASPRSRRRPTKRKGLNAATTPHMGSLFRGPPPTSSRSPEGTHRTARRHTHEPRPPGTSSSSLAAHAWLPGSIRARADAP